MIGCAIVRPSDKDWYQRLVAIKLFKELFINKNKEENRQ